MPTTSPVTWPKCHFCGDKGRPQVCPGDQAMHSHGEVHRPSKNGGMTRVPVCDKHLERVKAEWTMAPILDILNENKLMLSTLPAAEILRRERLLGHLFRSFTGEDYGETIKIATTIQTEATDGPGR